MRELAIIIAEWPEYFILFFATKNAAVSSKFKVAPLGWW